MSVVDVGAAVIVAASSGGRGFGQGEVDVLERRLGDREARQRDRPLERPAGDRVGRRRCPRTVVISTPSRSSLTAQPGRSGSSAGPTPVGQREADLGRQLVAAAERLGRAAGDDLAVDHHGDAVGEVLRLVHEVRRQEDRLARRAQRADRRPGGAAGVRVKAGRRLVEEQHVGVADEAEREIQPAALAAGQLAGPRVALGVELDELDEVRRAAASAEYQRPCISSSSPTVSSSWIPPDCSTTPMRSRRSRSPRPGSWPRTETVPELGRRWPSTISVIVVLPAPLGPSRQNTSPCSTSKLTPRRAWTSP